MVIGETGILFEDPALAAGTDLSEGAVERTGRRMWEFPNGERDAARAVRTARMDWRVERRQMYYRDNEKAEVVADRFAIVRSDTSEQLGSASDRYQCVQNLDAARLFEPLLETGNYVIDAAGVSATNRVWVTVRSNREFDITGKGDQVVSRLIGHWKHGGDSSVQFQYLPMRIVCSNMIQRAIEGNGRSGMRIRHYGNVGDAMRDVRHVFNLLSELEEEDVNAMMRMHKKPVDRNDVRSYFASLIEQPNPAEYKSEQSYERAVRSRQRVLADMYDRYEGGMGLDLCDRGNYWAAYSAVTEMIDHNIGVTGRKDYVDYAIFGAGSTLRSNAFEAALAA